jgi:SAM-dependent methyltransferase
VKPQRALYDRIGAGYRDRRRADPRLAAVIASALGDAHRVVDVGGGAGSYEPPQTVAAVDVSSTMLRQRPPQAAAAVQASAMQLPFPDDAFDASLAVLTLHHWPDPIAGLAELARVARRVVVLTWDPDHRGFWLTREYFPEILRIDRRIFPSLETFRQAWGRISVHPVLVPHDCTDGFLGAYWRRPHAYLSPQVRASISTFDKLTDAAGGLAALQRDLATGAWEQRHRDLLTQRAMDLGYRLVVARQTPPDP